MTNQNKSVWQSLVSVLKSSKMEMGTNVLLIMFLSLAISGVMTANIQNLPKDLVVGAIATKDIKADQNYEIVDDKSSLRLKQEAVKDLRPLYDFDLADKDEITSNVSQAFELARNELSARLGDAKTNKVLSPNDEQDIKNDFLESMGQSVDENSYLVLRKYRFLTSLERLVNGIIQKNMESPIVASRDELKDIIAEGIVLRDATLDKSDEDKEVIVTDLQKFVDAKVVKESITVDSFKKLEKQYNIEFLSQQDFEALASFTKNLIRPNTTYNAEETENRKLKAEGNVKNVVIKIKRGESVIRSGDRFEPWHITVIDGMRQAKMASGSIMRFLGVFLFVNLLLLISYNYATKYIRKFSPSKKDLIFLGLNLVFFLGILRFGVFLAASLRESMPFSVNLSTLYYAIPVVGGAMLVRFVLNSGVALIFAVILALFSGVFIENNLELSIYYLVSGVFAAHVISNVQKRSTVLLCGIYTGLVNLVMIYSLNLISLVGTNEVLTPYNMGMNALSGFLGGVFTAMIVLFLTPIVEIMFNYTTDIKLLELANLSHPLLKEMIVKAPGTYHHSQIVGILSEAGAQSIGANALLARVACYYHDIGKMKKPQYFIENQKGENPHDKLTPSMSALIIESHVRDGIEMARQHKLPQKIADIIPEHQGTKLIGYFYNKAKKMQDPALGEVDEKDYRYPGPKPQTKEGGIIMLADTCEAAVRSLPEKTPSKIRGVVEKLVNQHFIDEQLDECDLTLKDLHRIAEAFIEILLGIYHHRVEYPETALLASHPEAAKKMANAGVLHALPEIQNQSKTENDSLHQQPSPEKTNIAPLFGKKGS